MNPDYAMTLTTEAMKVSLMVGAPLLGLGLLAGLVISIFQATTQINESSLQFLPKVLAALVGVLIFGPWMLTTLIDFARRMILLLPDLVR